MNELSLTNGRNLANWSFRNCLMLVTM